MMIIRLPIFTLIATLENPIGEKLVDTLSYTMATSDGRVARRRPIGS
jgi:hypothetical protein